jgi:hypothetical protein
MSTLTQVERLPVVETKEASADSGRREHQIRRNVLGSLGSPSNLLKVAVLPLWGNKFRVNVWTGDPAVGNVIPHSYFVTADASGTVLQAEPPIQKLH